MKEKTQADAQAPGPCSSCKGVFRHWTRVGDLGGGPCGAEEFSKLDPRYQASVGGIERNPRPVTVASFTDGNDEGQAEFKALRIASRLGS